MHQPPHAWRGARPSLELPPAMRLRPILARGNEVGVRCSGRLLPQKFRRALIDVANDYDAEQYREGCCRSSEERKGAIEQHEILRCRSAAPGVVPLVGYRSAATSIRSVTSALTNGEAFTDKITERHSILERQDDASTD